MILFESDRRLQRAWWLLSLDDTADFYSELWVPSVNPRQLTQCLREAFHPYLQDPTSYLLDPSRFTYKCFRTVERSVTPEMLLLLSQWAENVYIQQGSDRSAEWTWDLLAGNVRKKVPNTIEALDSSMIQFFDRLTSRKISLLTRIRERLEGRFRSPVTDWDRVALTLQNTDRESVKVQLELIITRNVFDYAWECASEMLSDEQLDRLYKVSRNLAAACALDTQGWAFPGSWRFRLLPFLEHARSMWA